MTAEAIRYPLPGTYGYTLDPEVADLRAEAAPRRVRLPYGDETWLVTRLDDAKFVLGDPRFSRAVGDRDAPRMTPFDFIAETILGIDPPHHTHLRKLAARAFTVRRVEALRDATRTLVRGLVDDLAAAGPPASLTEIVAVPMPVTVICTLLGVPTEDRASFRTWSASLIATDTDDPEVAREGNAALLAYVGELVTLRRKEPADDLISAMLAARDADERLSDEEVVMLVMNLLIAGHETTTNQLPNFCFLLLRDPRRWAALAADPGLVPRAVEELLRYVPLLPGGAMPRYATEDVEVGGVTVPAGESVVVDLAAANRDPAVFPGPEGLDLAREHNPHVAFGHGAHHCIGAPLARMELQEALTALVTRLPGLRLAVPPEEVRVRPSMVTGLVDLPVTW